MRLTVSEAASLLGESEERIYARIEDDRLPAQRIGGQFRINRTELLEWATERGLTLAPRVFASRGAGVEPFVDALRAGGIHYDVRGDGAAVMNAIVDAVPLRDGDDRDTLRQFVLARDGFGLSVVAAGIAIPQVRTPAVVDDRTAVVLAFPEPPLAIGGKPVGAIFFFVSPTVHAHLMLLAQLTACLNDDEFLDAVVRRLSADEILAAAAAAEERL